MPPSVFTDLHVLVHLQLLSYKRLPVELPLFPMLQHVVSDQPVSLDLLYALPLPGGLHLRVHQHRMILLAPEDVHEGLQCDVSANLFTPFQYRWFVYSQSVFLRNTALFTCMFSIKFRRENLEDQILPITSARVIENIYLRDGTTDNAENHQKE